MTEKNISFKFLDYNSNLIFFFQLSTYKGQKARRKDMDFLAAEFDEGFFVGAIAKDFCFLTVGQSYNNMREIPWFCFNQSHYRSAFGTELSWMLNLKKSSVSTKICFCLYQHVSRYSCRVIQL